MADTRRLYLLRHAQAAPGSGGGDDYDRALDSQGEADATALGRLLARRGIAPSLVVSSGSARTRGTWTCVERSGTAAPVVYDDTLYEGGEDAYRAAAARDPGDGILLLGHNPSIAAFARRLAGLGEDGALERLRRGFPKCGLAVFRVGAWDLEASFLEEFLVPPFPQA